VFSKGSLGYAEISSNGAWLICGGGFGHWGYALNLDRERSANGTNVWQMYFRREESPDQLLATYEIPATNSISASVLSSNVVANYDLRLIAAPLDLSVHQAKIQCLLHFGKISEARQACRDILKAIPEDWWGNLVNALVLAETKDPDASERLMTQWANRNRNFFSYLDLAYYYQLRKEPQKAAAAMVKATEYDANTDWGDGGNSEFRGYHAAFYACQAGQYQAAVKLCDKLLLVTVNGDYAKNEIRGLRNAAIMASQGKPISITLSANMLVFDPFDSIDLDKLLQTKIDRPRGANRWNE
jgi:tetratricopeptide (TPR) repeat protein